MKKLNLKINLNKLLYILFFSSFLLLGFNFSRSLNLSSNNLQQSAESSEKDTKSESENDLKKSDLIKDLIKEFNEKLFTHPRQVTFQGSKSGEGYFSTDGKKLIFQSERFPGNPFYQIYILDLLTGDTQKLSPGNGKTTCAWIHPREKKAMWSSTHLDPDWELKQKQEIEQRKKPVQGKYSWSYDEYFDIFESDLKGAHVKRLTKERGYDAEGSYSPDGGEIAFASNRTGYSEQLSPEEAKLFEKDPSSQMEIYIMKSDGSHVRRLTHSLGYDGGPFFSADGKKITWRRFDKSGATAEIFTMNRDGSEQSQVTKLNAMSWAPYYHPSGKYIIFSTSVLGFHNFELFIVDAEGKSKPVRVTFEDDFDGLASFSPDGKKLTWTHRDSKGESQIYIADWNHELALKQLGLMGHIKDGDKSFSQKLSDFKLSPEIKVTDAKDILGYMASAKFRGRLPGSKEEGELAKEITGLFKKWNLTPVKDSFIQTFNVVTGIDIDPSTTLKVNTNSLILEKDFRPLSLSRNGFFENRPLVFAGYGLYAAAQENFPAVNSYDKLNVEGKWVVIFKDLPGQISKERRLNLLPYARMAHKITVAKNFGAYGVIFIDSLHLETKGFLSKPKFEGSPSNVPVVEITLEKFLEIFNLSNEQYYKIQYSLDHLEKFEELTSPNTQMSAEILLKLRQKTAQQVIGVLHGPTNSRVRTKALIIGAHMDHLGTGEVGNSLAIADDYDPIHYGADDNASGVTGVLELAHYYSQKKIRSRLPRDIYFSLWSGEEMGVLGSQNFVDSWEKENHKNFRDDFLASINLDMIGRFRERLFVQGTGSSMYWAKLAEKISIKDKISLSLQKDPYLPTDAISFYLKEIPSISFFTGVHSDYHTPRDTVDKINFDGLAVVVKTVQSFIDEVMKSGQDDIIFEKVQGGQRNKSTERSFRIYLGTIPDYSQEGNQGVKISGVSKNSPAEKAGLQAKDIIVEFDGKKIESIHDYVFSLQSAAPKKQVSIKVLRSQEILELKIIPELKE